jgi:hypothetical protein
MASFEVSADDMTIGHLEVTDDRFPGVTFTGTAESVYEQMKALNPRAFSDVDSGDVVRARSVRKRSTVSSHSFTYLTNLGGMQFKQRMLTSS